MLTHYSQLVFAFAALLPAQTTHVVQGGGTALQLAINTAAPGDILDVMPGSYAAVTVTRGLRMSLRPGASVVVPFLSTLAAITVSALPGGEAVVVTGGTVQGVAAVACAGAILCDRMTLDNANGGSSRIDGCSGPVTLQQIANSTQPTFGSLVIVNSGQVSFTSCTLPRTSVTNANVTFADCSIRPYGGSWPTGNAPSLRVRSGHVSIAGGRVSGGVAASLPYHESGILLEQGELVLAGAARIEESQDQWSLPQTPALDTLAGAVRIDPAVVLVGTPPMQGPAVVTNAHTPSLAVAHNPGSANYQLTLAAEPHSLAFTLLGLPVPVQPSPWGDLWLVPESLILDVATVPANGSHAFAQSLTGLPPLLVLVAQSATLSPTNTIAVSVPVRFVWD